MRWARSGRYIENATVVDPHKVGVCQELGVKITNSGGRENALLFGMGNDFEQMMAPATVELRQHVVEQEHWALLRALVQKRYFAEFERHHAAPLLAT